MKKFKLSALGGTAAVAALVLAGCGVSNEGGGETDTDTGAGTEETSAEAGAESEEESPYASCTPGESAADTADLDASADSDQDITIGAFNGWDESFAASHLMKYVLEEDGFEVDIQAFDAGPGYTGVAQGDIDFLVDSWLPLTHSDYIEQYDDSMEAQGCWYDNAKLTIAVNEDSPAQTIGDLAEMGDEYGNRLVGIEAGAGLTSTTEEAAIPTYGLEDYDFQVSSTPAMLAELKKATDAGENIAVTLWRPHWAYDAFPVRDLEDPEGAMGGAEGIWNFSRTGFTEENPYVSQLLNNLVIDDEHLASLENVMFSEENYNGEDNDAAVEEWVADNADFVDDLRAGALA
ncbi:glycine betaine ABC transporter substrate-binding protein [Brevibacterium litoralis]|uniref:glycine betaine ABC transporter substrate-binding protein n=1 Tax=Brevibacterium litoralis TaxID=3138935 RepID=UPI0032ECD238